VVAHRFDDIVFHKWVVGPTVEGKVCSAIGFERASVVYQPSKISVSMKVLRDLRVDRTYMSLAGW